MNVGEIKEEVIKMLGNGLSDAGHPFITPTNMLYRWITRSCNEVPRLAAAGGRDILSTFEELFEEWKATTVNNQSYLDRPATALIVREVYSFDKTGALSDVDTPRLVYQAQTQQEFDQGRSPSESAAFPTIWVMKGNRIYFRPMPVTGKLTDVRLYGIKREASVFTSDAQVPMLGEDWHEAVMYATAAKAARALGYWERMREYNSELGTLIGTGVSVPAQEDLYDDPSFDLGGLLGQEDIYDF